MFSRENDWSLFRDRMDIFLACNAIPVDRHKFILLTAITEYVLQDLSDALPPTTEPQDFSYTELLDRLTQIFAPQNVFQHRKTFYAATQNAGETLTQYWNRLETLAAQCHFQFNKSEHVRDRFTCGLRSSAMLERLNDEQISTISLEKVMEICLLFERESEK